MNGPRRATNKNSSVIEAPTAVIGWLNNWRMNNTKRRPRDGTTPKGLYEEFGTDATIIDRPDEQLRDPNAREKVSFESL